MSEYKQCCHCHSWIDVHKSDHVIFHMLDGTTQYAHHCMNGCCAYWFKDSHTSSIDTAEAVCYKRHKRGGDCNEKMFFMWAYYQKKAD